MIQNENQKSKQKKFGLKKVYYLGHPGSKEIFIKKREKKLIFFSPKEVDGLGGGGLLPRSVMTKCLKSF